MVSTVYTCCFSHFDPTQKNDVANPLFAFTSVIDHRGWYAAQSTHTKKDGFVPKSTRPVDYFIRDNPVVGRKDFEVNTKNFGKLLFLLFFSLITRTLEHRYRCIAEKSKKF